MDTLFSSVTWNTPATWMEANDNLAAAITKNTAAMADVADHAYQIRQNLESLFSLMDNLCRETCPDCSDVCCRRAWVWIDFKDLLFFHLADVPLPEQQLLSRQGDRCRYGGPDGCRLDRLQRPFVCTWYICPEQKHILRKQPTEMEGLLNSLEQIKRRRRLMEDGFIQAVRV